MSERARGNHFDNISNHPKYIAQIGGVERWRTVQRYLDRAELNLDTCPHCGGTAIINSGWAYYVPCVSLICTGCGCGAGRLTEGGTQFGRTHETIEECVDILVSRWNARKGGNCLKVPFTFPVSSEAFAAHQEKLCGFPIRGKLREITDTWVENINAAYEEGRANDAAGLQNSLDIMDQLIAKNRCRPVALKLLKEARHWVIYAWKQGKKGEAL